MCSATSFNGRGRSRRRSGDASGRTSPEIGAAPPRRLSRRSGGLSPDHAAAGIGLVEATISFTRSGTRRSSESVLPSRSSVRTLISRTLLRITRRLLVEHARTGATFGCSAAPPGPTGFREICIRFGTASSDVPAAHEHRKMVEAGDSPQPPWNALRSRGCFQASKARST
jgi:hypothetical protein